MKTKNIPLVAAVQLVNAYFQQLPNNTGIDEALRRLEGVLAADIAKCVDRLPILQKSSCATPVRRAWEIFENMADKPRAEVLKACDAASIAYHTSRNQYAIWKAHKQGAQ